MVTTDVKHENSENNNEKMVNFASNGKYKFMPKGNYTTTEVEAEILEAKGYGKIGEAVEDSNLSKDKKAPEAIKLISEMTTVDMINEFIEGDERKGVTEAAKARIEEITE